MGSTEGFLRPLVGKPARMGRRAVTVNEGTRAWRHTPLAALTTLPTTTTGAAPLPVGSVVMAKANLR